MNSSSSKVGQLQKKNQHPLISSDESMITDESFNSSEEELFNQRNNYKNSVYYLQEQMNHFFTQNPDLKDEIKLETYNYEDDNQIYANKQELMKQMRSLSVKQKQNEQEKQEQTNQMWNQISKEILKGVPKNKNLQPSLDTINNRLNIFRAKVDKVDYIELLAKEMEEENIRRKESKQKKEKNKLKKEEEKLQEKEDEITFFSFKKKMQSQFKSKNDQDSGVKKFKNKETDLNNSSMNSDLSQNNQKKGSKIFEKLFNDHPIREPGDPKSAEYQTQTGQIFYQVLQQNKNNKQQMRKLAAQFIRQYNKKMSDQLKKVRTFPPQMPKFQEDENKHLNILLPELNQNQPISNKTDLFSNLDTMKVELGSIEGEFIKMMEKIIDGKIIDYWKETQANV